MNKEGTCISLALQARLIGLRRLSRSNRAAAGRGFVAGMFFFREGKLREGKKQNACNKSSSTLREGTLSCVFCNVLKKIARPRPCGRLLKPSTPPHTWASLPGPLYPPTHLGQSARAPYPSDSARRALTPPGGFEPGFLAVGVAKFYQLG